MRSHLPHLSKQQVIQLAKLIEKILLVLQPEQIWCLGTRTTIMQDWSCFWPGEGYRETIFPTTFDLLILTTDTEKRPEYELIQLIEQQAASLPCEITCMVQKYAAFMEGLPAGYRFDTTVYRKAVPVYNNGKPLTADLTIELTKEEMKTRITTQWNRCFTTAQRFFKTATDCQQDNWPEQAVFNLHQAAQHTCMAILRGITGYRSTTHNLSRLLALIDNFSMEPSVIFPRLTREETELFNLLNKAYSDARYKEDYTVSAEKAAILIDRIKELMSVAESLYQAKLQELDREQPIVFPITNTHETTV
ncbi:HEPN domain-containing protein [Chitinophaga ginsengisegetis]|uniref:HEPN domain-containing protein n=1 Tax=Chitinophaga ginsengisegetis TaxID=393003 RepID=UPI000DB92B07|nr:HEPN domain-containing protein [Chitinophaga ginsengisegetis]MDR6571029.1 HEPN domain-containing protein [Chitinophaga ginsengisegetis]MDR6650763.1 HEPN domain-containing protein [Chitinophaga ginsengisegetis]MDR6657113.1 HEPN domain-containing protein [Chitinophaga ginsengisegetis]